MRGWRHTLIGGAYASAAVLLFVVGLVGGLVCRSIPKWDLTQPQAVLIGGAISGSLVVLAAYIAFHGQANQLRDERERHREMLAEQRTQLTRQLDAQRAQSERADLAKAYSAALSIRVTKLQNLSLVHSYLDRGQLDDAQALIVADGDLWHKFAVPEFVLLASARVHDLDSSLFAALREMTAVIVPEGRGEFDPDDSSLRQAVKEKAGVAFEALRQQMNSELRDLGALHL